VWNLLLLGVDMFLLLLYTYSTLLCSTLYLRRSWIAIGMAGIGSDLQECLLKSLSFSFAHEIMRWEERKEYGFCAAGMGWIHEPD